MAIHKIEPDNWQQKLNQMSAVLENKITNIEVAGLDIGDQTEAESITLRGFAYDPKSDIVEIIFDELDHNISSPTAIYYSEERGLIDAIEIVDVDKKVQIISFVEPLLLS
ncbi:DUF5335 family protein [Colwelliaceae bacterium 6471]